MRLLVSGSHGLIGSVLVPSFLKSGHHVIRLVRARDRASEREILWDPIAGRSEAKALEGLDAAVHLAGESIAIGRWTAQQKTRIRESRVRGTRVLCEALARLSARPRVLVVASAIGYYGSRGDAALTEESPPGAGFLADLCQAWEQAVEPADQCGIRVVNARLGIVLSPTGGALGAMLPPFRLGLGGRLGSGRHYMSWVALDDVVGAIHHVLRTETLRGPVNVVAPHPVTNREFTRTLGRVIRRPAHVPVPACALRFILGELADDALLASARVVPEKLQASRYAFRFPELEPALRHLLQPG